jgi:Tat protein translocase TatB subunit
MLDFGFSEILLTSAIALVVLGPERLPKVARQVGNWMGRARAMARQLSEQLEREVSADELLKEQSSPKPPAANRIAPPEPTPHIAPADPYVPPPHAAAGTDPHTAPHAEYEPPTAVSITPPSND